MRELKDVRGTQFLEVSNGIRIVGILIEALR